MDDIKLTRCKCGGIAAFSINNVDPQQTIHVQCDTCGLRTPEFAAGLEYSAKQKAADIWNAGENMWPRWVQGYQYLLGDQVTHTAHGQTRAEHWINERDKNANEPGQSGRGWRLVGYAD